ncbi:ergothioneine biosynthesis glutamate--cysteine ligase EgtA [Streptomyces sp. KLOTTS4A1]|uniref:ergothioneine biosynthesis glutamate--cysteine ligase EgtA n=1 Tax=Streptomyces sp. KLOTTS4A1 TaxID=3390996 RepID=UPI0039F5C90A
MPLQHGREPTGKLGELEAEQLIRGICFKNGPPRRTGVELEWLLQDAYDPLSPVAPTRLASAVADVRTLPLRSAVSVEPGGQLELSSPPTDSVDACVACAQADLALVRKVLESHGLVLSGHGHDPWHSPRRLLAEPRYRALETYLDRFGPAGRSMMCSTASVQVCVDAGEASDGVHGYERRWRFAHLLGPVLLAAFAHSPLSGGVPTGWKSTRQHVWACLDPARSSAPADGGDPRAAWAAYALDAPVLCVRNEEGPWTVPEGLSFRDWVRGRGPRPVTEDDVLYHLTTLFPPVRPRGHLELRMIDAQPGADGWVVPLAVTTALFDDPVATRAAARALESLTGPPGGPTVTPAYGLPDGPTDGPVDGPVDGPADGPADGPDRGPRHPLWSAAARHGLADPRLHEAAVVCFTAASKALARTGASPAVRSAVDGFYERYVAAGRCPADDLLDSVTRRDIAS